MYKSEQVFNTQHLVPQLTKCSMSHTHTDIHMQWSTSIWFNENTNVVLQHHTSNLTRHKLDLHYACVCTMNTESIAQTHRCQRHIMSKHNTGRSLHRVNTSVQHSTLSAATHQVFHASHSYWLINSTSIWFNEYKCISQNKCSTLNT